jgi:hypothetical protein
VVIQTSNHYYIFLSQSVKNLIVNVFFNYDNIRLNLSEFVLNNAYPVFFLIHDTLYLTHGTIIIFDSAD